MKDYIKDITFGYDKTDDRKNKIYAALLYIHVEWDLPIPSQNQHDEFFSVMKLLTRRDDLFADYPVNRYSKTYSHTYRFRKEAVKPSEILTEEQMQEELVLARFINRMNRYAVVALKYRDDAQEVYEDESDANRLLAHFSGEAVKAAREIVRYEQRLAALEAELVAEAKAQVKRHREHWKEEAAADKQEFRERAITLAMEKLMDRATEDAVPGIFRSGHKHTVAIEIPTPDVWLAEHENKEEATT